MTYLSFNPRRDTNAWSPTYLFNPRRDKNAWSPTVFHNSGNCYKEIGVKGDRTC